MVVILARRRARIVNDRRYVIAGKPASGMLMLRVREPFLYLLRIINAEDIVLHRPVSRL